VKEVPYWFPVVTLALGALGTVIAEWWREQRGERRTRQAARDAFQRETLLALQDALMVLGRVMSRVHMHDLNAYRETGEWGKVPLPDELDEGTRTAIVGVNRHRVRVLDDDVRNAVKAFVELAGEMAIPPLSATTHDLRMAAAEAAYRRMTAAFEPLQERIGVLLREVL
jgi:hypothetical protein